MCDCLLSRLAIETLVHPNLLAEAVVQHNHIPLLKKFPGNIYLIMVLEVCHTSFAFKMGDADTSLEAVSLNIFPIENVSKFANEAQRFIKTMEGVYALPYQLSSQLLQKVCASQSPYFNRTMQLTWFFLAMEKAHGTHRDQSFWIKKKIMANMVLLVFVSPCVKIILILLRSKFGQHSLQLFLKVAYGK